MSDSKTISGQVLQLPPVLDLNAAAPLQEKLLVLRGVDLVLDAGLVERAGGQCLQVLVAARQAWVRDARQISLSAVSDAFLNSLRQMGLGVDHLTTQEQMQ
jgi:chemotaxis protein CheX